MQGEAAKVHEEVQEALQWGRQKEAAAVREDLLRARLLAELAARGSPEEALGPEQLLPARAEHPAREEACAMAACTVSSRASVVAGHRHRINARTQKWRCSGEWGLSAPIVRLRTHRVASLVSLCLARVTPPLPIGGQGSLVGSVGRVYTPKLPYGTKCI